MVTRRNLTLAFLFLILWILLALALPVLSARATDAQGTQYMVTRGDDPIPDGCQVDDCSLREAVISANSNPGADIVLVLLHEQSVVLSLAGVDEDNALTGDLDITEAVTVSGAVESIDGGGIDRVFDVHFPASKMQDGGGNVYFSGLSISGGVVTTTAGEPGGAAIRVQGNGGVHLTDVNLQGNVVHGGYGGAIANNGGWIELIRTGITGNTAADGGAITNFSGLVTMRQSAVVYNGFNQSSGSVGGILTIAPVITTPDPPGTHEVEASSVTIAFNEGAGVGVAAGKDASATMTLHNTIIGNNSGLSQCVRANNGGAENLISNGYNLASDSSCNLNGTADLPNTNPRLVSGFGLAPNSPAIDTGDSVELFDQQGIARPYNVPGLPDTVEGDDRGAYEFHTPLFVVTRLDDPAPDGCFPTNCSLREAIETANQINTLTTIIFTEPGTVELSQGPLTPHTIMEVIGYGADSTIIDANGLFRAVTASEAPNLPLCLPIFIDLTITGGNADRGAGIKAEEGCGFILDRVVIRDNHATDVGGGVAAEEDDVEIRYSAIISNSATNGGGVAIFGRRFRNSAIINTTISGNSATGDGGGIYYHYPLTTGQATLLLNSVTVIGNSAGGSGDALTLVDVEPPQNGTVQLVNSIMAGVGDNSACATIGFDTLTFTSQGYNLSDDQSCNFTQPTDLPNTDPQLGLLVADGATYVHVPMAHSPALDSGNSGNLSLDQRGLPRPIDLPELPNIADGSDRGAYEQQIIPPTAVHLTGLEVHSSVLPGVTVMLLAIVLFGITFGRVVRVSSL